MMYLLLVFLFLKSGQIEVHHSTVDGPRAKQACEESIVLTENLYRYGKFFDGPRPDEIKSIRGRCEEI